MTQNRNIFTNQFAFLIALCFFLSTIEYAIPKPLPFLRLGLTNVPVLLALKKMPSRQVFLLVLFKVLGQAFLSGTLISYVFVFSIFGSFASALGMFVCYKLFYKTGCISNIGISVFGSLCNNIAQIVCARVLLFGENTKFIAPILLISGLCSSIVLGVFSNKFEEKSQWFLLFCGKSGEKDADNLIIPKNIHSFSTESVKNEKLVEKNGVFTYISLLLSFVLFGFFFWTKSIVCKWIVVLVFFLCACLIRKKRVKVFPSIMITVSVTFFCLLSPIGKVLFRIGSWTITEGALREGLKKSSILVGMVFFSQCVISKQYDILGKRGAFFSKVFYFFGKLHDSGGFLLQKQAKPLLSLVQKVDTILYSVYPL